MLLKIKDIYSFKYLLLSYAKSYSCVTSLCGRSHNSRWTTYLEEIAYLQYF